MWRTECGGAGLVGSIFVAASSEELAGESASFSEQESPGLELTSDASTKKVLAPTPTTLEEDCCWLVVLQFLTPKHLSRYATVSCAARCRTEPDVLWSAHLRENDIPIDASGGHKAAFVSHRRVLCVECRAPTHYFFPLLGVRLCPSCEAAGGSRYELCSKTEAKHVFLLESNDFKQLPSIRRNSPWATKSTELRLLLRSDVEACAARKFGGMDALHEERRQRRLAEECQGSAGGQPTAVVSEYEVRLPRANASINRMNPFQAGTLPASFSNSGALSDADADSEASKVADCDAWAAATAWESSDGAVGGNQGREDLGFGARADGGSDQGGSGGTGSGGGHGSQDAGGTSRRQRTSSGSIRNGPPQRRRRGPSERAQRAPPEPLGLSIETAAPFAVRSVDPQSMAARVLGVQVGDRLLAVGGTYCATFKGGWPAIKAALSRRPLALRFQRTYHQYQKGALAPPRRRGDRHRGGGKAVAFAATAASSSGAARGNATRGATGAHPRSRAGSGYYAREDECDQEDRLTEGTYLRSGVNEQNPYAETHSPARRQNSDQWAHWQQVDYLAMGVTGLEVVD